MGYAALGAPRARWAPLLAAAATVPRTAEPAHMLSVGFFYFCRALLFQLERSAFFTATTATAWMLMRAEVLSAMLRRRFNTYPVLRALGVALRERTLPNGEYTPLSMDGVVVTYKPHRPGGGTRGKACRPADRGAPSGGGRSGGGGGTAPACDVSAAHRFERPYTLLIPPAKYGDASVWRG